MLDAELVGLVLVDDELGLRRLEAQIGVGEDEEAALLGVGIDLVERLGNLLVVARIFDDEFDRHFAGADRNGRRRGGKGLDAGNAAELALQFADDHRSERSRSPHGFRIRPTKAPWGDPRAIDGEDVLPLRHIHEDAGGSWSV